MNPVLIKKTIQFFFHDVKTKTFTFVIFPEIQVAFIAAGTTFQSTRWVFPWKKLRKLESNSKELKV